MMPKLWTSLNLLLDRIASVLPDPLLCAIRLYWGWQFFLTGKGKLGNLDGTAEFFASLNLPAPKVQAMIAGGTECVGGLLLLAGIFSRVITLPLIFTMVVAYLTAHREVVTGIFGDSDTFVTAPPFLFLFACVLVFVFGPGRWSVDGFLNRPLPARKE
ncbi:MAG TPA: DoxX family protein [Verrucomicrobium sp.]|nr:DoxX family protein [Verrucomicrobium sp.]